MMLGRVASHSKEDGDAEQVTDCQEDLPDEDSAKRFIHLETSDGDSNSETKPISDFIDLTVSPDPPLIAPGPAVVRDNNLRALKDCLGMEHFKEVFSRIRDPGRRALDADELKIVKIVTLKANTDTELAYYRAIREWVDVNVLNGKHFRVLSPRGLLKDEMINAYAALLNMRNDEIAESREGFEKKGIPNTHLFNTFYLDKMKGIKES